MTAKDFFKHYRDDLTTHIANIDFQALAKAANLMYLAYKQKRTIYTIGNGGSASTASHMALDLSKTVRGHKGDSKYLGFKIVSLANDVGFITAWANDSSFDHVFSGQLENLGQHSDVLVAISSSGNSANIINGVKTAKKLGMKVIGISGFGGGKLKNIADISIVCAANAYGPVEDIQLIVNHMLTNYFLGLLSGKLK